MVIIEERTIDIPKWSLPYLINGDLDTLTEDEIESINTFENYVTNNREYSYTISPQNNCNEFNANPYFGLPCSTIECQLVIWGKEPEDKLKAIINLRS